MIEDKNGNFMMAHCGIPAIYPGEDEDYIIDLYNTVLESYNYDLYAVRKDYPLTTLKIDKETGLFYANSIEEDLEDPLLKWNNMFHAEYWKSKAKEVNALVDKIIEVMKANNQPIVGAAIYKIARDQMDAEEEARRQQMSMNNAPQVNTQNMNDTAQNMEQQQNQNYWSNPFFAQQQSMNQQPQEQQPEYATHDQNYWSNPFVQQQNTENVQPQQMEMQYQEPMQDMNAYGQQEMPQQQPMMQQFPQGVQMNQYGMPIMMEQPVQCQTNYDGYPPYTNMCYTGMDINRDGMEEFNNNNNYYGCQFQYADSMGIVRDTDEEVSNIEDFTATVHIHKAGYEPEPEAKSSVPDMENLVEKNADMSVDFDTIGNAVLPTEPSAPFNPSMINTRVNNYADATASVPQGNSNVIYRIDPDTIAPLSFGAQEQEMAINQREMAETGTYVDVHGIRKPKPDLARDGAAEYVRAVLQDGYRPSRREAGGSYMIDPDAKAGEQLIMATLAPFSEECARYAAVSQQDVIMHAKVSYDDYQRIIENSKKLAEDEKHGKFLSMGEVVKSMQENPYNVLSDVTATPKPLEADEEEEMTMAEKNAFDMLVQQRLDETFGARQKLYDLATTEEERDEAMNMDAVTAKAKLDLITGNTDKAARLEALRQYAIQENTGNNYSDQMINTSANNVQAQPVQTNDPSGGVITTVGSSLLGYKKVSQNEMDRSYVNEDDSWMLPTEEELASGKVPMVRAIIQGQTPKPFPEIKRKRTMPKESEVDMSDRICVKILEKDENGKEEYKYYGKPEAIEHAKREACAMDFKEMACLAEHKRKQEELYNLASELRRYNVKLAEDLLWAQNDLPIAAFQEFIKQCRKQLMEYRNNDKFCLTKSMVIQTQDKTFVTKPKPTTREELERYAKEEKERLNKLFPVKQDGMSESDYQERIERYKKDTEEVQHELDLIKNTNDLVLLVKKLQCLENVRVYCSGEEEEFHQALLNALPPIYQNKRNTYMIWKKIMRVHKDSLEPGQSYDEWFDNWWKGPVDYESPSAKRERYVDYKTIERYTKFEWLCNNQPDPKMLERVYMDNLERRFREFDGGKVPEHQTLYEYFNGEYGMGYMHNCILNQRLREQSHSLLKYFDPETYMEKLRARWIQRQQSDDYGANVQYDELLNSEAYQKKRQSFIEKIFCKNPRGSII